MNLFCELYLAVQSDLNIGSDSTLFPIETVKSAVNRAYIKSAGLFLWAETEDAQKTSTQANTEYYDYPDNFRADSIWKITVDGVDYEDPVAFKDYLYEKENDMPSGRQKMWASQWRRYFIYPTPTTSGDNNIVVWGQRIVDEMVNDADVTIFSYSMPECNEAIVLEAEAILKNKGQEEQTGAFRSQEAKAIFAIAWNKVKQNQAKYQKTQAMFTYTDFYATRNTRDTNIGRF